MIKILDMWTVSRGAIEIETAPFYPEGHVWVELSATVHETGQILLLNREEIEKLRDALSRYLEWSKTS